MNKIIKVPPKRYISTLCKVVAHVIALALLAFYFLPEFKLNTIILIGLGYYVFKVINYLMVSLRIKDNSILYNGFFKKGILVAFDAIKEIEIEGPSQFNSNHRIVFWGERESAFAKRQVLVKFPIYWFSKKEVTQLLKTIQTKNPSIEYHKQVILYLRGEDWKHLFINYLIQYSILIGMIIFIIMKYN
jgi:hypothetical protein